MEYNISNTSIKKAYKLFGTKTTDNAVYCITNWFDTFYSECFTDYTPNEVSFIKAVIYLLSVNRIDDPFMPEYLDWYKKH